MAIENFCETIGEFLSIATSFLKLILLSPLLLTISVLVGVSDHNPIVFHRGEVNEGKGIFRVCGFHSVYIKTRGANSNICSKGNSTEIAEVNGVLQTADVSRLPRLLGVLGNRVDFIKPEPPLACRP